MSEHTLGKRFIQSAESAAGKPKPKPRSEPEPKAKDEGPPPEPKAPNAISEFKAV